MDRSNHQMQWALQQKMHKCANASAATCGLMPDLLQLHLALDAVDAQNYCEQSLGWDLILFLFVSLFHWAGMPCVICHMNTWFWLKILISLVFLGIPDSHSYHICGVLKLPCLGYHSTIFVCHVCFRRIKVWMFYTTCSNTDSSDSPPSKGRVCDCGYVEPTALCGINKTKETIT